MRRSVVKPSSICTGPLTQLLMSSANILPVIQSRLPMRCEKQASRPNESRPKARSRSCPVRARASGQHGNRQIACSGGVWNFGEWGITEHSPATGPDTSGIRLCLRSGKHNFRFASESNSVAAPLDLIGCCLSFLRRPVPFGILESKGDFHSQRSAKSWEKLDQWCWVRMLDGPVITARGRISVSIMRQLLLFQYDNDA